MAARASRLSRVYTAPTGLFGVLMITALVFGPMAARSASMSGWKLGTAAGTSTMVQPAASIHVRYSGKYGDTTTTSSPGWVTAAMDEAKAAAAPAVRYK